MLKGWIKIDPLSTSGSARNSWNRRCTAESHGVGQFLTHPPPANRVGQFLTHPPLEYSFRLGDSTQIYQNIENVSKSLAGASVRWRGTLNRKSLGRRDHPLVLSGLVLLHLDRPALRASGQVRLALHGQKVITQPASPGLVANSMISFSFMASPVADS